MALGAFPLRRRGRGRAQPTSDEAGEAGRSSPDVTITVGKSITYSRNPKAALLPLRPFHSLQRGRDVLFLLC